MQYQIKINLYRKFECPEVYNSPSAVGLFPKLPCFEYTVDMKHIRTQVVRYLLVTFSVRPVKKNRKCQPEIPTCKIPQSSNETLFNNLFLFCKTFCFITYSYSARHFVIIYSYTLILRAVARGARGPWPPFWGKGPAK